MLPNHRKQVWTDVVVSILDEYNVINDPISQVCSGVVDSNWRVMMDLENFLRVKTLPDRGVGVPSPTSLSFCSYLQICFQSGPHTPVTKGSPLSQVCLNPLLSFGRAQSRVGPSPGDPQHRFMHVD